MPEDPITLALSVAALAGAVLMLILALALYRAVTGHWPPLKIFGPENGSRIARMERDIQRNGRDTAEIRGSLTVLLTHFHLAAPPPQDPPAETGP